VVSLSKSQRVDTEHVGGAGRIDPYGVTLTRKAELCLMEVGCNNYCDWINAFVGVMVQ
jgi:hypothetical protein